MFRTGSKKRNLLFPRYMQSLYVYIDFCQKVKTTKYMYVLYIDIPQNRFQVCFDCGKKHACTSCMHFELTSLSANTIPCMHASFHACSRHSLNACMKMHAKVLICMAASCMPHACCACIIDACSAGMHSLEGIIMAHAVHGFLTLQNLLNSNMTIRFK